MKEPVLIWTDGSCHPNPGPGGWGAILKYRGNVREIFGGSPSATNNEMELMAAIQALTALKRPCDVNLYTDSQYVRNGIVVWTKSWLRNNWRTSAGKPVENKKLWLQLMELDTMHSVTWFWVRGHVGNPNNERADQLARLGRSQYLV